jgi:hypothetical protein
MHPGPNQSLTLNTTTPGAENSLMHLGPNQSLTLNTTTPGAESSLMHLDPNQSLTLNTTTPGAESSLMHLGPNQSLTLNTTVHGAIMMRTLGMIIEPIQVALVVTADSAMVRVVADQAVSERDPQ